MKKLISILISAAIVIGLANLGAVSVGIAAVTIPELPDETNPDLGRARPRLYGAAYLIYDEHDERAQAMPYDTEDTFKLHSRPGCKKTIYLDFNGRTTENTLWNHPVYGGFGTALVTPPFSLDADKSTDFSDLELTAIQQIWQIVAEDYAIFDVDITTEDPGEANLERTSPSDQEYGMRACIGGSNADWLHENYVGGIAYLDIFGDIPSSYGLAGVTKTAPAMIFSEEYVYGGYYFTYDIRSIAGTVSHEVGHTLGLSHDGKGAASYFGSDNWAPLMGAANGHVAQWSKGEYPGATNKEDDLAIIGKKTGFVPDEAGNSSSEASVLTLSGGKASVSGIVGRNGDKDYYKLTLPAPAVVNILANPGIAFNDANLDIKLTLLGSSQSVIETCDVNVYNYDFQFDPFYFYAENYEESHSLMAASLENVFLPAGTYYILIEGTGATFPESYYTDYSAYASVGNYTLDISAVSKPVNGITLDKTALSLASGNYETIYAALTPPDTDTPDLIWTCDNDLVLDIVSYDNECAVVFGCAPGTATLTATTVYGGFSASCEITVFDVSSPANDQACVDYFYNHCLDELARIKLASGSNEFMMYMEGDLTWLKYPLAGTTVDALVETDILSGTYLDIGGNVTRPPNSWREIVGAVEADCPYYAVTMVIKKGAAQSEPLTFGIIVVPECLYGDADNNGETTAADVLISLKIAIGLEENDYFKSHTSYQGYRIDNWYDYFIDAKDPFATLLMITGHF